MKNILVIQGGGRPKGNTAQLIDSFVKGAVDAGNTVHRRSTKLSIWNGHTCSAGSSIRATCFGIMALRLHTCFENYIFEMVLHVMLYRDGGRILHAK